MLAGRIGRSLVLSFGGFTWPQPRSTERRIASAADLVSRFHYGIALLVDPIENPADALCAGWPARLHIIDGHGVIAYKGQLGLSGFEPEEVKSWLAAASP